VRFFEKPGYYHLLLQTRRNLHDDSLGFSGQIFNELLQLLDDAVQTMTRKSA